MHGSGLLFVRLQYDFIMPMTINRSFIDLRYALPQL